MKTYQGQIEELKPNQIFVFGSNTEGRHGKGAALWAMKNAQAIYGRSTGIQGNAYAIVTKDLRSPRHPSISGPAIVRQIKMLYDYANEHKDLDFVVAYCGEGINLNGYSPGEMAFMFVNAAGRPDKIPENMVFEEQFAKMINAWK